MIAFVLAIVAGAFLLFQVQPIMGKWILPWFGGGPGVWSACLLFFQLLLLCGYFYAHVLTARIRHRTQVIVHGTLLVFALALLPVTPGEAWKPQGSDSPTWRIVLLLLCTVGLPYFLLASTGPLLQRWLSLVRPGPPPYRLYALSNAASLLALLSYPFLVEPSLTRRAQSGWWSLGFAVYAACCGWSAWVFWRTGVARKARIPQPGDPAPLPGAAGLEAGDSAGLEACATSGGLEDRAGQVSLGQRVLWFALPFCASVLLLAVTNKISQDVAIVPFLWILPLAAYLLSFIVAFDSPRWYVRPVYAVLLVAAFAGICWAMDQGTDYSLKKLVGIYAGALLVCCTVCHGELYRLRPPATGLTGFYLAIAAGGATGGMFVAVLAPVLFEQYYELHWGLLLCGALFLAMCAKDWGPGRSAAAKPLNPFVIPEQQGTATATGGGNRFGADAPVAVGAQGEWFWMAAVLTAAGMAGLDRMLRTTDGKWSGFVEAHQVWLRAGVGMVFLTMVAGWVVRGHHRRFRHWRLLACLWLVLGLGWLGTVLWQDANQTDTNVVYRSRNFYGTLKITEHDRDDPLGHYRLLQHGAITHGIQFVDRDQSTWATTYYAEGSGFSVAMNALPDHARRLGVVGLGTGSIAAFGKPGDYLRFYDINPEIRRVAMHEFSYLAECRGTAEVILGDARLSLERELPQEFDLIALDAFTGDAIPVHLLTREAFEVYDRHLRSEGIIVVHISNHYVDLEPVVANLAREFRFEARRVDYDEEDEWWKYASTWILLTRSQGIIGKLPETAVGLEEGKKVPLWTDDFASLYQVLK